MAEMKAGHDFYDYQSRPSYVYPSGIQRLLDACDVGYVAYTRGASTLDVGGFWRE